MSVPAPPTPEAGKNGYAFRQKRRNRQTAPIRRERRLYAGFEGSATQAAPARNRFAAQKRQRGGSASRPHTKMARGERSLLGLLSPRKERFSYKILYYIGSKPLISYSILYFIKSDSLFQPLSCLFQGEMPSRSTERLAASRHEPKLRCRPGVQPAKSSHASERETGVPTPTPKQTTAAAENGKFFRLLTFPSAGFTVRRRRRPRPQPRSVRRFAGAPAAREARPEPADRAPAGASSVSPPPPPETGSTARR